MTAGFSFRDILTASARGWCGRKADDVLLSLALPLNGIDPLNSLPFLSEKHQSRFLWDGAPGLCLGASGQCQQIDLVGPRRFEQAQRFADAIFARLIDVTPEAPTQALPRMLFAFSFFDQTSERLRDMGLPPAVTSVFPRWQLTNQGRSGWLRLNGVATNEADARELAEELWLMHQSLLKATDFYHPRLGNTFSGISKSQPWQDAYRTALMRGIDLVEHGTLDKLVLAVRQSITLNSSLDPLQMLSRLRDQQSGSCRFLWQRTKDEAFFGASPERLLSIRRGQLISDALAGTASNDDDAHLLLKSDKDLREHELVVASITNQLIETGLEPHRPRRPQLARHGRLVHLHTPITASIKRQLPLHIANNLHPTPAVAGLPRREAMSWLRTLEPFDRGSYAAPIGWMDTKGNSEFRVAIRCGYAKGKQLELTAGAGLVKGSVLERELQEVSLKLAVLADQLELNPNTYCNFSSRTSMT